MDDIKKKRIYSILFVLLTYILYFSLFKYFQTDFESIFNYIDSSFLFSGIFDNFTIWNGIILKFFIYSIFFILLGRILFKISLNAGIIKTFFLFLILFMALDFYFVSITSAFISLIHSQDNISSDIYKIKYLRAVSYNIPDIEFIFYFFKEKEYILSWYNSSNLYYLLSFIFRMFLILLIVLKSNVISKSKNYKVDKVLLINVFFTTFLIFCIFNIKKIYNIDIDIYKNINISIVVILSIISASIFEELIFRNIFLKKIINNKIGFIYANIIQSCLFAITHFNFSSFWDIFRTSILGLFLGFLWKRYGLFYSIVAHLFYNFAVYILYVDFF